MRAQPNNPQYKRRSRGIGEPSATRGNHVLLLAKKYGTTLAEARMILMHGARKVLGDRRWREARRHWRSLGGRKVMR